LLSVIAFPALGLLLLRRDAEQEKAMPPVAPAAAPLPAAVSTPYQKD